MAHGLADLEARVDAPWARTGHGPATRLVSEAARQDSCRHGEASGGLVRAVQRERGRAWPRTGRLTLPEATHRVLAGSAAAAAQGDEPHQRGGGGHSRWNWMAPAVALMERISPQHGAALASTHAGVLAEHPLRDDERRAARFALGASAEGQVRGRRPSPRAATDQRRDRSGPGPARRRT